MHKDNASLDSAIGDAPNRAFTLTLLPTDMQDNGRFPDGRVLPYAVKIYLPIGMEPIVVSDTFRMTTYASASVSALPFQSDRAGAVTHGYRPTTHRPCPRAM